MKTTRTFPIFKTLAIAATVVTALLPLNSPASGLTAPGPDPRTIVVTLLGGQQQSERGELTMSFEDTRIIGFDFKDTNDRAIKLSRINRTRPPEVSCEVKDAECGSLELAGGTKIGACVCPRSAPGTRITPTAIKVIVLAPATDSSGTSCWENKEQLLSVCTKIGAKPPTTTQTKEHILLAKQVGVPSL